MQHGSYRETWTEISLDAIHHNVKTFKDHIGNNTKYMAVVKADGYGHGAVEVANEALLAGAEYIAVAILDEAVLLRDAGVKAPILVMGYTPPEALKEAIERDITLTVFTLEAAEAVNKLANDLQKKTRIHIKVETGMNRIGLRNKDHVLDLARSLSSEWVSIEGIFTHFADADNKDTSYTDKQFESFLEMTDYLQEQGINIPIRHCCNSAGTIAHPSKHLEMVRVGIAMYGLYPEDFMKEMIDLTQAMTLKTKPVFIKNLQAQEYISYGCTFTTERDSKIATIPIGYADGFSRLLSNRGDVIVNGERAGIVGRVCMDQSMIDVTGIDGVDRETVISIFGDEKVGHIPMAEVADLMGTIHYETTCLIGKRIPRVYVKDGREVKEKSQLTE
ncbi:alanine racemase [Virgibacillus sp. YIM 98842]|uniref:alanine racemase n=1 Tax=Virgibacillus sp. YIM 98842 TaxID=2663533 RepID=UPI0013D99397|nr:alanine racemase [Virgibacillus sp. YIM 98842]